MGIADRKVLFCVCHGNSEGSVDKKTSTREYKNKTVYDCLNDTFTPDCGSTDLNIPLITIGNRLCLNKRAHYTPDLLTAEIYVASGN